MVVAWTNPTNRGKARPDSEQSDAICMLGLERNLLSTIDEVKKGF